MRRARLAWACLCDVRRLVARLFPRDVSWRLDILRPVRGGVARVPILRDAIVACQEGQAPKGDATGLALVAWSAVHGFATLSVDRALPFEGLELVRLAPEDRATDQPERPQALAPSRF